MRFAFRIAGILDSLPPPPFPRGIPAWSSRRVGLRFAREANALAGALALEGDLFDRAVRPSLSRFTEMAHLLPVMSEEEGPYATAGGLIRYGLERALVSVRVAEGRVLLPRGTPGARRRAEAAWKSAGALAMLARSVREAFGLHVTGGDEAWTPLCSPLDVWCRARGLRRYSVTFTRSTAPSHCGAWAVGRVLDPLTIEWLNDAEPDTGAALVDACDGPGPADHPLVGIVTAAEAVCGRNPDAPSDGDRPDGPVARSGVTETAERLLGRLADDLSSGRHRSALTTDDSGTPVLRYPEALRPYGSPEQLVVALREAGWLEHAPDNPLQFVRRIDGGRGVKLRGRAAERLRPFVAPAAEGPLP